VASTVADLFAAIDTRDVEVAADDRTRSALA